MVIPKVPSHGAGDYRKKGVWKKKKQTRCGMIKEIKEK
jgi:hypothetical protein